MKEQILKILEEGKKYGYNNEEIADELLNLHSVIGSSYKDDLLKKADSMMETGKIWHTNKAYTDGIDCALDNMKIHIEKCHEKHY